MKVSEIMQIFQEMPVCDRIYLLCQMLQRCISYELYFIRSVLSGSLKDSMDALSKSESFANKPENLLPLQGELTLRENLEKLCCYLALVRIDNHTVAKDVFQLLDDRQILLSAEEIEDYNILNNLRLLYVLAIYHPALSFEHRHHLLSVYLRHLDEIYDAKLAEDERKREEAEQAALLNIDRPSVPSDEATILSCELKGVYKRPSDKRYPYVLEVEWSDGAYCHIQRTYGDFFTFQNKLLDLFPEESGQRSKKNRVIPFLPGRKLLSGRSNRELAEKRLQDLWQYTHDLFVLPARISQCKHVREFFKPRPSDLQDDSLPLQKMTSLLDVRNKDSSKSRHPSAPAVVFLNNSPSNSPSRPRSAIHNALISSVGGGGGGRVSHTLPTQQSPGQKEIDSTSINRRFTYPARPNQSAFTPVTSTPSSSTERLHSSSQTSLGSSDQVVTPTTTACHVVTPPTTRANGSPAFSVGSRSSVTTSARSSGTGMESPSSLKKLVKPIRSTKQTKSIDSIESNSPQMTKKLEPVTITAIVTSSSSHIPVITSSSSYIPIITSSSSHIPIITSNSSHIPTITSVSSRSPAITSTVTTTVTTPTTMSSNWADRCSPPPELDLSFSPFQASTIPSTSVTNTVKTTAALLSPSPTTLTTKDRSVPFSPSLPQLYQYGNNASYSPYPPFSYTPTNFESPSPSPKTVVGGSGRWPGNYTPVCHTPTEFDHFRKWLKGHRLHKYDYLFQNMSFDEVSKLSVEKMKEMGMTQGAAKKLQQKIDELIKNNITSFRDIPLSSISRRPSTSSLPAALLLEQQRLTPSSSIDQLSLHGSTCSLDLLQAYNNLATPTHTHRHSDSITDAMISSIDTAIVEAGPSAVNGGRHVKEHRRSAVELGRGEVDRDSTLKHSDYADTHTRFGSVSQSSSPSPTCGQVSVSPPHTPAMPSHNEDQIVPTETSKSTDSSKQGILDDKSHRPIVCSPTQHHFSTPQSHRKDTLHNPTSHVIETHMPRIPHALVPTATANRIQGVTTANWSHGHPIVHNPVVVPQIVRGGRLQTPFLAYTSINGLIRSTPGLTALPPRMPNYPITTTLGGIPLNSPSSMMSRSPVHPYTCYNCGSRGHQGTVCPAILTEGGGAPRGTYSHHFPDKPTHYSTLHATPPSSSREPNH